MADEKIQTNNESIARQCNRIIYIEPNDVYDRDCGNKQVGETLTPKYEDSSSLYFLGYTTPSS